jgi:prepilin-type N-terminal cleavage/methylation domain-containing protein
MELLTQSTWRATLRRKPGSSQRGFSLTELLTVALIACLIGSIIVVLTRPMMTAGNAELASLQELQLMDTTLYRLQREVRQSDPNGIFYCSGSGYGLTCNQGSNLQYPTSVTYLAILTARQNGNGETTWDSSGRPSWTGFNVYWLVPDDEGTNSLRYSFGPANIGAGSNPSILNSDVAKSVSQAVSVPGMVIAQHVQYLQTMVNITTDRVALRLSGLGTVGTATNELSVQGDVYARN